MPFHRVTPFLRPAVRSILDQTMRDFEFLIVDNGTGAGLAALGEEGRDPRIRLIPVPGNLGVPAAHNLARAQAQGEFIANMDSDDLALPMRLARQVAALRAEPGLGVLSTHALMIDEAGRGLRPQFTLATWEEQRTFTNYSLPITNPTVMARRGIFEQFPMRTGLAIASDYDFFARVVEQYPCRALPEVLLHYRRHADQITVSAFDHTVFCACVNRLVIARRRAGRPEDVAGLLDSLAAWVKQPPLPAESYAHFSRRALAEGFPLLAVFLARRSFSLRRTPAQLAQASATFAAAVAQAPASSIPLARMFFTGPLRTHRLKPL